MVHKFSRILILSLMIAVLVLADVASAMAHPAEPIHHFAGAGRITYHGKDVVSFTNCQGGTGFPARRGSGGRFKAGQTYVCHNWRFKDK